MLTVLATLVSQPTCVSTGLTVFYVVKTSTLSQYPSLLGSGGVSTGCTSGIRWGFGLGWDMQSQQGYSWAGTPNGSVDLGCDASLANNTIYTMSYRTDKTQWTVKKNGQLMNIASDTSFPTGTYNMTIVALP